MDLAVILTPQAQEDFLQIVAWIAHDAPLNAARFDDRLENAILSLKKYPDRCPLAPENEDSIETIRHLIVGTYRIIFWHTDQSVYILHIRHAAREPFHP